MKEIILQIESNDELWGIIDKNIDYIFIHKFNPNEAIQWKKADLKIGEEVELKGILVRDMEFDLQTDLNGLKRIIDLNTRQLRIYQFEKPVPDTLTLGRLPEDSKNQILRKNGLKHIFWINYEFVTIISSDEKFLKEIEENPKFGTRMKRGETGYNN